MHKRPIPILVLLVLAVMAAAGPSGAAHEAGAPIADARALSYLQRWKADTGAPGVSAAIAVNGRIVFSGGVGEADLQSGAPQDGRTVHNLGSVSGTQSLVAVMQLVEQGKVGLDDDIRRHVPWFPAKSGVVTLRQVLTHTSGIRNYREDEFGPADVLAFRHFDGLEESTLGWRDDPLEFAPGTRWMQSVIAPNLIQAVVEAVSGESFESYLTRHVWRPAGMADTRLDVPTRVVPRRGQGYQRGPGGELCNAPATDPSHKYAATGMLSTDEDMVRFGIALNAGRLLKPGTLAEVYRLQLPRDIRFPDAEEAAFAKDHPGETKPSRGLRQGLYFLMDSDSEGRRIAGRSGSLKGAESRFTNYYRENVVVAVHFNLEDAGGAVEMMNAAEALAQLYLPAREPGRP